MQIHLHLAKGYRQEEIQKLVGQSSVKQVKTFKEGVRL